MYLKLNPAITTKILYKEVLTTELYWCSTVLLDNTHDDSIYYPYGNTMRTCGTEDHPINITYMYFNNALKIEMIYCILL